MFLDLEAMMGYEFALGVAKACDWSIPASIVLNSPRVPPRFSTASNGAHARTCDRTPSTTKADLKVGLYVATP
jgi:hypothetical protein